MKHTSLEVNAQIELCLLTQSAAPSLFALVDESRQQLREWLPWVDQVQAVEDSGGYIDESQQKFKSCQSMNLGIVHEGQLVGMCGYNHISNVDHSVSIGYWLGNPFQGRGIATTCVKFLIKYAFEVLDMNCVRIAHAVGNTKSNEVIARCGFTYEGTIRSGEFINGRYVDIALYSILKSEWCASNIAS